MTFKLGKTPARPGAVKLRFATFADACALPPVPPTFGHDTFIADYGMLGNDQVGDCVWAGAAHEHMLWRKAVGSVIDFTTDDVLTAYSAVTGYTPDDPNSDQGTDMEAAAKYRRQIGITDRLGNRHKIGAYLALDKGDLDQLKTAAYLFGAVGIGVLVPEQWQRDFEDGKPWDVCHSPIEGGHYVPMVGFDGEYLHVITWGRVQKLTVRAFERYCDEAIVYLSQDQLDDAAKTPEGFDTAALQRAMRAL